MTITLPSGRKIRSASQRQFVLITDGDSAPRIVRRSDDLARLRQFRYSNWAATGVIVDQRTGQVV